MTPILRASATLACLAVAAECVISLAAISPSSVQATAGTAVLSVLLTNWPYTIFVIMPTNRRLMNTPVEAAAAETRRMVRWWGGLHAGRSALGLVATLIFLWAQR